MRRTGWTKNWRKKWDNPSLRGRINHLVVWDWIISNAEWNQEEDERAEVRFSGKIIRLQLGQLTCGSQQIATETGCAASTVRRVIAEFVDEHLLEQRTDHQCSLISVTNWGQYQGDDQPHEQRMISERATDDQRLSTKEEDKKIRTKKTYAVDERTSSLYDFIGELCEKANLDNKVNLQALDIQVQRYSNLQLRVETRSAVVWLLDKGKKTVTTAYLGNWYKKATEIQKRDTNKLLEKRQEPFKISPDVKAKLFKSSPIENAGM